MALPSEEKMPGKMIVDGVVSRVGRGAASITTLGLQSIAGSLQATAGFAGLLGTLIAGAGIAGAIRLEQSLFGEKGGSKRTILPKERL